MKGWKIKSLGELVQFTSGGTPSKKNPNYWNGDIPWISAKTMKSDRISTSDLFITKEGLEHGSRLAPKGSVLFLTRGSGLFNGIPVCLVESPVAFNQDVKCITSCSDVENEYIYFWLKANSQQLLQQVDVTGIGAGKFDTQFLKDLEVIYPERKERKKIIDIAHGITCKIDINERINRNLYAILRLSFINDYVKRCEEHTEWSLRTLGELTAKFSTGLNPRKNFVLGQGDNYYVTIKNMSNNRIYLDNKCAKVTDEALKKINERSDLQPGDCLFSGIGTIGRVYLIDEPANNWNISESVFTIRPSSEISSEFLYLLLLSDDVQNYALSNASGSVQKGIRMSALKNYPLRCPNKEYMEKFTEFLKPIIAEIKKNEHEIDKLSAIRDTLLPRLMSGEIDVSEVEI